MSPCIDASYTAAAGLPQNADDLNADGVTAYPELTGRQYNRMEMFYREQIGLLRDGYTDGLDAFYAWLDQNRKWRHPNLSAEQHNALCRTKAIEFGVLAP